MDRVKRIRYLSPMRAAKVQASLRIRAVSPEPSLLAHTSSESRGTFRKKARSLAPLNGWACAVKICHDGMLEDTNSLDGAHIVPDTILKCWYYQSIRDYWADMTKYPRLLSYSLSLVIQDYLTVDTSIIWLLLVPCPSDSGYLSVYLALRLNPRWGH